MMTPTGRKSPSVVGSKAQAHRLSHDEAVKRLHQTYVFIFVGLPVFLAVVVALFVSYRYALQPEPLPPATPLNVTHVCVEDPLVPQQQQKEHQEQWPLVLHGSFVTLWPALQHFSLAALAKEKFELVDVFVSPVPVFRRLAQGSLLGEKIDVPFPTPRPPVHSSSLADVFTTSLAYWQGPLHALAGIDADDEDDGSEILEGLFSPPISKSVPMASAETTMIAKGHMHDLHYWREPQLVVVLTGSVRVTLFEPSDWPYLYFHPSFHPFHGYTQATLYKWDSKRFPLFGHAQPYEAVLDAGDVLVLPPGWALGSLALNASVIVNVPQTEPLPPLDLPSPQLARALQRSLAKKSSRTKGSLVSIVGHLLDMSDQQNPLGFVRQMLVSRYHSLPRVVSQLFVATKAADDDEANADRPYDCQPLLGDIVNRAFAEWSVPGDDGSVRIPVSSSTTTSAFFLDDLSEAERETYNDMSITNQRALESLVTSLHANATEITAAILSMSASSPSFRSVLLQDAIESIVVAAIGIEHVRAFLTECFL